MTEESMTTVEFITALFSHVDDRLLDFRQAPSVAIVEQETALSTEGVLA
jgi:hypothetical protein